MRTLAVRALHLLGAIAPLVALVSVAGCGARSSPSAEIGAAGDLPGALHFGFHYSYRDSYRGWPVRPLHRQHPVRSSFLDPRGEMESGHGGYHFGIDVSVDDAPSLASIGFGLAKLTKR